MTCFHGQLAKAIAVAGVVYCVLTTLPSRAEEQRRSDFTALFPQAADAPKVDHEAVSLRLKRGRATRVDLLRFSPKGGLTQWASGYWCGIVVDQPGAPRQALVTVGAGRTEAVSCDGVDAIGGAPSIAGLARIALTYRVRSPNAASLTAVVIAFDPVGRMWRVDEALSDKADTLPGKISLARLRRFLSER